MRMLVIVIIAVFAFGCKPEAKELTIDRAKMVEVIADIHLAEEMQTKFRSEHKDSSRQILMSEIRQIHNIDSVTLSENLIILQSNPELAVELYTEVYTLLDGYAKETSDAKEAEKQKQKIKRDSINNITKRLK